jgi:aldehyde:ferredoxin oxidoreductase
MTHFDEELLMKTARRIHAMKIRLKMNFGFSFDDVYLPKRLEKAITTTGQVTSEAFDEQVKIYRDLVEEDLKLFS